MEYIKKGICIWCSKEKPEVTFNNRPHIIPYGLGGKEIGHDVCDECNRYFGQAHKGEPNTNLVFKEVFGAIRTFSQTPKNTDKDMSSVYFKFDYDNNEIKIKSAFSIRVITRQFKRSLYEVFLQKLHVYNNDGLNAIYDDVRNFARYNQGDLSVYYVYNSLTIRAKDELHFGITDNSLRNIVDFGFHTFWFMGHLFLLELIPIKTQMMKDKYLQQCADTYIMPWKGNEKIIELTDIMQTDFFMERFNRKNIDINNKLIYE